MKKNKQRTSFRFQIISELGSTSRLHFYSIAAQKLLHFVRNGQNSLPCRPGLTKTSNHTISKYEKTIFIQFLTTPYVQKIF